MSSLLALAKDLEQQSKAQQQSTGEMLKAAFSEHEKSVKAELSASAKRISDAISAHEQGMTAAMQSNRLSVLRMVGRTWLTITLVSVLLIATSGSILWWQGQKILDNYQAISVQKDTLTKLNAKTWGVSFQTTSDGRRF
ncbi:MbeB family mobilization protein, partial [Salmonella enterica subsp. enterica serovar Corvallis]